MESGAQRLGLLLLALLAWSCAAPRPSTSVRPPTEIAVAVPVPVASTPQSSANEPLRPLEGTVESVGFFDDGTLGIATKHEIIAFDSQGIERRSAVLGAKRVYFGPEAIGIEGSDGAAILEVPSLEERWKGPGSLISGEIVFSRAPQPAVLFWRRGRLVRLALPVRAVSEDASVEIELDDGARTAFIQWHEAKTSGAAVFDVASEKMLKRAPVLTAPTIVGGTLYGIDVRQLVAVDVAGASPPRRSTIPCSNPADPHGPLFLGPVSEEHLVVMCGSRGLLFNTRRLSFRGDVGTLTLSCKDSDGVPVLGLPGFDRGAPNELVTRACTDEVRIDLVAAKYRCSDDPDLVRASGGAPVGRCTEPGASRTENLSASYVLSSPTVGPWSIHAKSLAFDVERGARHVSVNRDESRLVYELPGAVVLRSLPSGEIVRRYATTQGPR